MTITFSEVDGEGTVFNVMTSDNDKCYNCEVNDYEEDYYVVAYSEDEFDGEGDSWIAIYQMALCKSCFDKR